MSTLKHWMTRGGVIVALLAAAVLARDEPYVIKSSGERIRGRSISVTNPAGDLLLDVDGRVRFPFKRGTYRFAWIPKPKEVTQLEGIYEAGRYADVIRVAGAVFDKYKFVGWGDHVAYLEGMAYLKQETPDAAKALEAFQKGREFAGLYGDELMRGFILGLLESGKRDQAAELLDRLVTSAAEEDAAFAFNTRGRILVEEGKRREAVLEYLKTLLLFEPGEAGDLRAEARQQVVSLLKDMNDARYKRFENME